MGSGKPSLWHSGARVDSVQRIGARVHAASGGVTSLSERILVQANVTAVALDRDKENSQAMKD
jgi:hypothetical protein